MFQETGDELLEAYSARSVGKALIRLGRTAEACPLLDGRCSCHGAWATAGERR